MSRPKNRDQCASVELIYAFLRSNNGPAAASAIQAALCVGVQPVLFRSHCTRLAEAGELVASHDSTGRWQYGLPHVATDLAAIYAPRLPDEYHSRIIRGVLS